MMISTSVGLYAALLLFHQEDFSICKTAVLQALKVAQKQLSRPDTGKSAVELLLAPVELEQSSTEQSLSRCKEELKSSWAACCDNQLLPEASELISKWLLQKKVE